MNDVLSQYSNIAVYTSIAIFTAALVAYSLYLSAGLSHDQGVRRRQRQQELATTGVGSGNAMPLSSLPDESEHSNPEEEPGRRAGNVGMSLTWLATIVLGLGVLLRGLSAGRFPWGNMYEFSITAGFVAAAVFLLLASRYNLRWFGVFFVSFELVALVVAVLVLYTESVELMPALRSYWLIIHVSTATIATGAFTVSFLFAVLYLWKLRIQNKPVTEDGPSRSQRLMQRLPSTDKLDRLTYGLIAFTFPLWTFTLISGAIWAENAWGRYWGWDPKEVWTFVVWVVYAAYLHARTTAGWRGKRAAIIAIVGFGCLMFNYFGINLFITGFHSYAGV